MHNDSKKTLKFIIVFSISLLLVPTILEIVFKTTQQRDNASSEIYAAFFIIQSIAAIIGSLSGIIYFIVISKEKKALKTLAEGGETDSIWNIDELKYQTRFIFYKVQDALESKSISPLKDYATPGFLEWFKKLIDNEHAMHIPVNITETHIISCKDSSDNSKDKFVGYIKGRLETEDYNESAKEFSEIYHFIRIDNNWFLEKITGSNILNIVFA